MFHFLLRLAEYDVIATLNLNGDYISDSLAAIVGGIGIVLKYGGQNKVNPSFVIFSDEMMFRYMRWNEAADLIIEGAINSKRVMYDFYRQIEGATKVSCSGFGEEIVKNM